ncbi:hypothetical protein HPB49_001341 [Dermacentor silvarum]|uniref:Uncharacterized protein n=1 Tax=Dermacentor silvarum TaxID=543639 RepID=A0ACB8CIW0_DERSI|nr:hypothetical protein HPB49_001341 [Dermacentor silvarum]
MPQVTNTTMVKTSATPPADLPPGDLNLPQQLETTAAPSAPLCNEESTTSLNPVRAIPSLSVPLPPSSDSEEEIDTATCRKRRRECEDGVDDAAPCKQLPPPAAEAMTIQAAFVAEPLQRSSALLTMAPADVFTALLGDAVTAAPKPHDAATVRKHDSSGRASFQEAGASFCRTSRLMITEVLLSALPGVVEVRVNMRLDSVAVNADSSGRLQNLLAPTECTGFVHGVDRDISDHDLLAAVYSSVPVMSVKRSGDTVSFRFAVTSPPECINPYRMPFPVKSFRAHLVQCVHCGRYGNTTTACVFPERCLRCGGNTARAPVSSDDLVAFTVEDHTLQTTRVVRAGRRSARWRRWLLLPPVLSVDKKQAPLLEEKMVPPRLPAAGSKSTAVLKESVALRQRKKASFGGQRPSLVSGRLVAANVP